MSLRRLATLTLTLSLAACATAQPNHNSPPAPAPAPDSGAATVQQQSAADSAQRPQGDRGTAEVSINGRKVTINYGRPRLEGRNLLAQARAGMVWRLGMNQATEITTNGRLVVDGKELPAGKYSLWVRKPTDDTWTLAFHPKTGIWGAPPQREGYVAELALTLATAADSVEQLSLDLVDKSGQAELQIHWGTALLRGTFGVK